MFVDMGHVMCQVMMVQLVVYLYALSKTECGSGPKLEVQPIYDQYLLVGSSIQVNCTLKVDGVISNYSNQYNVNDLQITKCCKACDKVPKKFLTYNEELLTVNMLLENVTVNDSCMYWCQYYNASYPFKINIGEPPGKPSNLICISHNFSDLVCSAVLAKPSTNLVTNWMMQYMRQSDLQSFSRSCSISKFEVTIDCSGLQAGEFVQPQNYSITIQGRNDNFNFYVNYSFVLEMTYAIVKPNPVESLKCSYVTNESTSVQVTWKSSLNITLDCKLTVIAENNWDNKSLYIKTDMSAISYTLKDLVPYVNYSVILYIKPVEAVGDIYWSDGAKLKFVTQDDVPGRPPVMTLGSFLTIESGEQLLSVVLYWKNPPRVYWHGNISYAVNITLLATSSAETVTAYSQSESIPSICWFYKLKTMLRKTEYYDIEMWTMTRKGYSAGSARVMVPSWETAEAHKPMWVAVEIDDDQVSVSWMDKNLCASITSATYYWCTANRSDGYFECQDDLDWYTVNMTNGCNQSTQQWLNRTRHDSNVMYAVSLAIGSASGGMVWESFRFKNSNAFLMRLQYSVTSTSASQLTVTLLFDCGDAYCIIAGSRPQSYQILYDELGTSPGDRCPMNGKQKSFTANFSNFRMTLDDLIPNTNYVVCVQSTNVVGQTQMGDPVHGVTLSVQGESTLGIILGCALSLFLFLVILAIVICYQRMKQHLSEVKINLPIDYEPSMVYTIMDTCSIDDIQNKNEYKDSGKASSQLSSSNASSSPLCDKNDHDATSLATVSFRGSNSELIKTCPEIDSFMDSNSSELIKTGIATASLRGNNSDLIKTCQEMDSFWGDNCQHITTSLATASLRGNNSDLIKSSLATVSLRDNNCENVITNPTTDTLRDNCVLIKSLSTGTLKDNNSEHVITSTATDPLRSDNSDLDSHCQQSSDELSGYTRNAKFDFNFVECRPDDLVEDEGFDLCQNDNDSVTKGANSFSAPTIKLEAPPAMKMNAECNKTMKNDENDHNFRGKCLPTVEYTRDNARSGHQKQSILLSNHGADTVANNDDYYKVCHLNYEILEKDLLADYSS